MRFESCNEEKERCGRAKEVWGSRSNPAFLRVSNFTSDQQSTTRHVSLVERTSRLIPVLTMEMVYSTAHAARRLLVTAHNDRYFVFV
jgi:hypothetical protein